MVGVNEDYRDSHNKRKNSGGVPASDDLLGMLGTQQDLYMVSLVCERKWHVLQR